MDGRQDKLKLDGVLEQGYGIIPKLVMKDQNLTAEAKAIYAYIASYAGSGNTAFPSVGLMCRDLKLSKNRFYNHRKLLIDHGYLTITKSKSHDNTYANNIYTLVHTPCIQNRDMENRDMENRDMENRDMENRDTNNNSLKINSINNNSELSNLNKFKEQDQETKPPVPMHNWLKD